MRSLPITLLASGAGLVFAGPAQAQSCGELGELFYLGNTSGDAESVWLSQTRKSGDFRLEAAQHQRLVDRWSREGPSLRLSLSDTVSKGSGGTHRLYSESGRNGGGNDKGCLIDTQNQQVDFELPPAFQRPPQKPDQTLPTLPPSGIMPERPPGSPDQTLPTIPPNGVMPERPGQPAQPVPPGVVLPQPDPSRPPAVYPDRVLLPRPTETRLESGYVGTCPDGGQPERDPTDPARHPECRAVQPLTEGRRYTEATDWDVWADIRITDIEQASGIRAIDGSTFTASFGIDNRVSADLVLGLSAMISDGDTDSFGGLLSAETNGFSVGPYLAWQFADHATIELSASWGQVRNHIRLFDLATEFDTDVLALSADLSGDTAMGSVVLRPRFGIAYTRSENQDHRLTGPVLRRHVDIALPGRSSELGSTEVAVEAARPLVLDNDGLAIPFLELGLKYDFLRPDNPRFDTSVNRVVTPSEWSGYANAGMRVLVGRRLSVEMSGAYRSIGVDDLDIWEGRLFVSLAF